MLSSESKHYLKDCWGYDKVEEMDELTACCIIENIESEMSPGDFVCDREIWKAYCKAKGIKAGLTSKQFYTIRHRYAKAA